MKWFVLLAVVVAGAFDATLWQTYFDRCLVGKEDFLEDDGFCSDFKTNNLEAYGAIMDVKSGDTDNDARNEKLQDVPDDSTTSTTSTTTSSSANSTGLVEFKHKLRRRPHHHHRHHHQHLSPHRFASDPISNAIWPGANVLYKFGSGGGALDDEMAGRVLTAIQEWKKKTCIDFIPAADNSKGLLSIEGSTVDRCACDIGWPGNTATHSTIFRLRPSVKSGTWDEGCPVGTIIHELGHGLGLEHTHVRQDRNTYCDVSTTISERWAPNYAKLDTAKFTDEPLQGNAQAKAEEFYGSIMMYIFDSDMDIATGWATNSNSLTEEENTLKTQWKSRAGQRDALNSLDIRTVNNKYSCYNVKMATVNSGISPAAGAFMNSDQTIQQLVEKIGLLSGIGELSKVTLWKDNDMTEEHTAQPFATKLSALTTAITKDTPVYVKLNSDSIKFTADSKTYTVFVNLGWKLSRVLDTVKAYNNLDWTGKTIKSSDQTTLDKTKTLTSLNVANGATLSVS